MKNIKNILIWIIIITISIALIITSFGTDFLTNKKINETKDVAVKINNNVIYWNEINILTNKIIKQKNIKNLLTLDEIKYDIKNIIHKNINFSFLLKNNSSLTKNKTIINEITKNKLFKENDKFSRNLYETYLKKNNINEKIFQEKIKKNLKKETIKFIIEKSNFYTKTEINDLSKLLDKKIHFSYKKIKDCEINKSLTYTNDFHKENKKNIKKTPSYKLSYIDFNKKNIIKNIEITTTNIKKYYKKNIIKYIKNDLVEINYIFISNNNTNKIIKLNNAILDKNEINKIIESMIFNKNGKIIKNTKDGKYVLEIINKKETKKYDAKKIKTELIYNYKKNEARNYINKNYKLFSYNIIKKNISLDNISKISNLNIKTDDTFFKNKITGMLENEIVKNTIFSNNIEDGLKTIKIKNRYIFYNITKNSNKTDSSTIKKDIIKFLQHIENEKYLIKIHSKSKNNWKNKNELIKNIKNNDLLNELVEKKKIELNKINTFKIKDHYIMIKITKIELNYLKENETKNFIKKNTKNIFFNLYKKTIQYK